jgi:inward rectifier potassium channel
MRNTRFHRILNKKSREATDTGFSNLASAQGSRMMDSNGKFRVKRTGIRSILSLSFAHELIQMSWSRFLLVVLLFYILVNTLFAALYYLNGMENFMGGLAGSGPAAFSEAFFFSAQTLTTVGYGRINPAGLIANILASAEALIGLMSFALVTGLLYGRFARPVASLIYSDNVLFSPYQDGTALMLRLANARNNDLAEVQAEITLSLLVDEGDKAIRKYFTLELERSQVTALPLAWTLVHAIRAESPLLEMTQERLKEMEGEILVTMKGLDTTFSQTVYSRRSFGTDAFVWNARFLPCFHRSENGFETILEMDKLSKFELLA